MTIFFVYLHIFTSPHPIIHIRIKFQKSKDFIILVTIVFCI